MTDVTTTRRASLIGFFSLLLIIDWLFYFRHAGHFFQGDTVFLLNHRVSSLRGLLHEFVVLNQSGWFRPLAFHLFESTLYPVAGLNPIPYHIVIYALFFGLTVSVYKLALVLTNRYLAAGLATFFFTIHTANAFTTYDMGFMPDLLCGLFYVCATLAFLRYLQTGSKNGYRLSLVCFVGGLLSKEPAVTLPGILFLAAIMFRSAPKSVRERLIFAIRSIVPHALILVVYLAYAVGYLHVGGITLSRLFDPSQKAASGDYAPVLNGGGILTDAGLALTWAFNIPSGWWGQWQPLTPWMITYLRLFRALVLVLAVISLITPERKIILFGVVWFWLTILPALPIANHFFPYYVFLPIVGLSIMVGLEFAIVYDAVWRIRPALASAMLIVIFGGVLYVTNRSVRGDIRDNWVLGHSSRVAAGTLNDLKHFYPEVPAGITLYFADASEPIWWEHDFGGLIRMAYGNDQIVTLYQSQGDALPTKDVAVFAVHNGHLTASTRP